MLTTTDALTAGFGRPVAGTAQPTPLDHLDAAARRALSIQPLTALPVHLYSAFELLGDSPTQAHERAQSVIGDQKTAEGVGVQDDVDVSIARAKLAYAAEEYTRAVGAALVRYAALNLGGFWAAQGNKSPALQQDNSPRPPVEQLPPPPADDL